MIRGIRFLSELEDIERRLWQEYEMTPTLPYLCRISGERLGGIAHHFSAGCTKLQCGLTQTILDILIYLIQVFNMVVIIN